MAVVDINTSFIRIRNITDDSRGTGYTIQLLPDGGTAPADLITLTANAVLTWQYDFPGTVTNGKYTVYSSGSPAQVNGENVEIQVMRDGVVKPINVSHLSDYDGV